MSIARKYSVDSFLRFTFQRHLKFVALLFCALTVSACGTSELESVEVANDSLTSITEKYGSAVVNAEVLDDYFDTLEEHQRWLGSVALIVGDVVYTP